MSYRRLESLLFVSSKPLAINKLQSILSLSSEEMVASLKALEQKFNQSDSGIHLLQHEGQVQFVTPPEETEFIKSFLKQEATGELTRPSLETLTIIAYKGPITKPEIEQIRGINCSLILRNLLIRGLIEEKEDKQRLQPVYTVSVDFLQHLGLKSIEELPEYLSLHAEEITQELKESISQE
ncbi:MAG: Segregation and condensation protein B [Candidatus Uhrbacteria bacterium GW2011_GWE2_40_58]|nr:MAG: Segregation and condensation protein B [Candidatus Uhrbacteria bacterium GW2011_GWF2_40_263]KKR66881.1 MAG: Segregation and condensation protein B [Candidatus Uhrbacteria bacterium GW2011_GWE2_40_58]OGL93829.1 MAG: SMC-Scp complex subunit ScpB [Candidatus Uhrbacteria bacterium RIFOXYA2_FULL_40_9]OGL97979.1 MAG: SMC-Scp complex subunit ScpB [Candidatus Uhrbacteria bacterium RIFOXYB2_FULL_41_18]HBK35247.1 SMC-Scp complex subunit ScpB [Candidatus Uhrbacteria bacterium]